VTKDPFTYRIVQLVVMGTIFYAGIVRKKSVVCQGEISHTVVCDDEPSAVIVRKIIGDNVGYFPILFYYNLIMVECQLIKMAEAPLYDNITSPGQSLRPQSFRPQSETEYPSELYGGCRPNPFYSILGGVLW